jgi:WD40 repeat protein
LSVKWSENGNNFYTGLSNGHILKWDFKSGQVQLTLNIASNKIIKRHNKLGLDTTMIWTLNEINNKYLFSGDSNGTFRVWDCEFGVLIKEFKEHEADILTCCKNKNYNTIYFTGSDSLICAIQLINDEWVLTSKFRGQSHDVNSVCLLK